MSLEWQEVGATPSLGGKMLGRHQNATTSLKTRVGWLRALEKPLPKFPNIFIHYLVPLGILKAENTYLGFVGVFFFSFIEIQLI